MTSKHLPAPVKHPRFIPVGNNQDGASRLVREALRQAFELTPWNKAVTLRVYRDEFQEIAEAVAHVAGPELGKRVYINPVHRPQEKRVMIDPRSGIAYLKGTPPWGEPPAPEIEPSAPPAAMLGARVEYRCHDCPEEFIDQHSAIDHYGDTGHTQTDVCWSCPRSLLVHSDEEYAMCVACKLEGITLEERDAAAIQLHLS